MTSPSRISELSRISRYTERNSIHTKVICPNMRQLSLLCQLLLLLLLVLPLVTKNWLSQSCRGLRSASCSPVARNKTDASVSRSVSKRSVRSEFLSPRAVVADDFLRRIHEFLKATCEWASSGQAFIRHCCHWSVGGAVQLRRAAAVFSASSPPAAAGAATVKLSRNGSHAWTSTDGCRLIRR
jgi:hypothetical protein